MKIFTTKQKTSSDFTWSQTGHTEDAQKVKSDVLEYKKTGALPGYVILPKNHRDYCQCRNALSFKSEISTFTKAEKKAAKHLEKNTRQEVVHNNYWMTKSQIRKEDMKDEVMTGCLLGAGLACLPCVGLLVAHTLISDCTSSD